jgi:two-component system, LytTR family, response regulator
MLAMRRSAVFLDHDGDRTSGGKLRSPNRARQFVLHFGGATSATSRNRRPPSRIAVKVGRRTVLLRAEDIDWIEAANQHVRLHAGGEVHVVRARMKDMEERLDPSSFVRIHKSVIVNVDRVKELEALSHGEYTVTLRNGKRLRSGRVFGDRLKTLID